MLSEFRLSEMLKQLNVMVFPVLISTELDLVKTNDQPFEPPSLLRFVISEEEKKSMNK